jgi:hypothetical protein
MELTKDEERLIRAYRFVKEEAKATKGHSFSVPAGYFEADDDKEYYTSYGITILGERFMTRKD